MRHTLILSFILAFTAISLNAQIQSPEEFLGYSLGDQFTPHYKVDAYFKYVAEHSDMVTFHEYGKTYEGRELVYVVVTSAANQANIEEIRTNNLKRVGFLAGSITANEKPILWFSYNVHGNEASSSEAAMNTLYQLITERQNWLNELVVIMDPMINPDGRDRYVNWNKSVTGRNYNAAVEAREHSEPWPGGRVNHYYFDLNRDWSWQTQVESRQRIPQYLHWMPQIHVDFHEQGHNNPYFFPPAVEPLHDAITPWQRELQDIVGANNAKHFDSRNWLYFTKEDFDLFYPSYGDTWPIFHGALGMTYEQGGHSRAGLGVRTAEGDTLTLKDRLTHHTTTGLSTVETAVANKDRILSEFAKYFADAKESGSGEYKSFIISKSSNPDKVSFFLQYLMRQNIEFGVAKNAATMEGYNYGTDKTERVGIQKGDYVVSTYQPLGTLVRVLFEPKPNLSDSVTYDQTAWESFYSYGLDGFAVKTKIAQDSVTEITTPTTAAYVEKPYAYLAKWNSMDDLKYLAAILRQGVNARYSTQAFSIGGKSYDAGSLVITRKGNEKLGDKFDEIVKSAADKFGRTLTPVSSGYVSSGMDFGSSSVRFLKAPKVALLSGINTSSEMVGHIWHYFDQQIDYPVTLINADELFRSAWTDYDVLIMPSGNYGSIFDENGLGELRSWVQRGGTLIALERANNFLAGKSGFSLKVKQNTAGKKEDASLDSRLQKYGDAQRSFITNSNAGSTFNLTMDNSHPLAFGYGENYMSLKLGSTAFEYLENGWNVGVAKKGSHRSGFIGYKAEENVEESLSYGVQNMGSGAVVYMIDNPIFRAFWHNGKLLFGNAVFFVGN